jgi:hypothetical protein
MEKGKFWVGSYNRAWPGPEVEAHPAGRETVMGQIANLDAPQRLHDGMVDMSVMERQRSMSGTMELVKAGNLQMIRDGQDVSKFMPAAGRSLVPRLLLAVGGARPTDSTREADGECARTLFSAFDVDGPCLVATPYDAAWERLPRPEARSMSTCWVVGELDRPGDVVPLDGGTGGEAPHDPKRRLVPGRVFRKFKVLNKVKGMRQIMNLPFQEHFFL